MSDHFVVEWQETDELMPPSPYVSVRMQGRKAGLFRVKQVMREGLLLSHGAISFPVGTRLDIEDSQGVILSTKQHARVVANDKRGVSLAW